MVVRAFRVKRVDAHHLVVGVGFGNRLGEVIGKIQPHVEQRLFAMRPTIIVGRLVGGRQGADPAAAAVLRHHRMLGNQLCVCRAAKARQLASDVGCQPLLPQIGRRPANAAVLAEGLAPCLRQGIGLTRTQQSHRLGRHPHLPVENYAVQWNLRLAPLTEPPPINEGFILLPVDAGPSKHPPIAVFDVFRHSDIQRAPPINLLLEKSAHARRQCAAPAKGHR